MKRPPLLLLAFLGLVAFPQHVWANAGTPLMWAGMLHLVIGNALIGLLEGVLLGWLFGVPRGEATSVMIVANYASAWLGGLFIRGAIVKALPMDLTNGWWCFWVMVVVTYFMTLIIEWPFIAWALRGTHKWLGRSVRASFLVQSASYVLIFGWYWMASGTSLYTKMNIVVPADLSLPESVLIYFIAPADGDVYRRRLLGGNEQKIYELHSAHRNDRLFVRPSAPDTNRWDLVARMEAEDHSNPRFVDVLTNLLVEAAPDWRSTYRSSFGKVQGLGSATNSQWEFRARFWPVDGLRALNRATSERVQFSYETPFGAWTVRNAVHLPSDKVLFQLGHDQICAFAPVSRRVALLCRGRGPVAVIERPMPNSRKERQSRLQAELDGELTSQLKLRLEQLIQHPAVKFFEASAEELEKRRNWFDDRDQITRELVRRWRNGDQSAFLPGFGKPNSE